MAVKIYDLEDRATDFAKRIIRLCKALPNNTINKRLIDQIVRSSGSIGANYREANDALGDKDFKHKLKIARRETKETSHWLVLVEESNPDLRKRMVDVKNECQEIRNILSSIIKSAENKK